MNRIKSFIKSNKMRLAFLAVALVIALGLTICPVYVEKVGPADAVFQVGQGQYRITIGNAVCAQTADYTCDGSDDNVTFQEALDALPATGGQLFILAGDYYWDTAVTVTRAVGNVTIIGVGAAVYFHGDGVTPLFEAGDDKWVFSNLQTDAGGLEMGATSDWMWLNIFIDGTFYSIEAPDDPPGTVINELDDVGDVDVAAPTDQYLLYWNAGNSKWECQDISNYDLADLGAKDLDDLDDVDVTTPTNGYFIYWDGGTSSWKCKALADSDIPAAICRDSELSSHESDTSTHGATDIADLSDIAVDANLSAAAQAAIGASHAQNTDTNLAAVSTKSTPIDGDKFLYRNSASSDSLVTILWSELKAILKTYFDGIYSTISALSNHESDTSTHGATDIADVSDIAVDANLSAAAQAAISASHTQGTDTTLGTLTADVDFAGYMAIAMACDQGATLPVSPVPGQWFLHTPTGRTILYQYNAAWVPMMSIGSMTVYVDNTDGTDDLNHGTAVDANAFKTIQYAVNSIPGCYTGNVIIYATAENYDETMTFQGKRSTGAYTVTLQGTLTSVEDIVSDGNGDKGATTTQASFYEDGMTANEFQNKILKFTSGSNNGYYRIIDSNSNDAGTHKIVLCGLTLTAQPVATDTATVYDWGTTVNNIVVSAGQSNLVINDIKLDTASTSGCAQIIEASTATFNRCYFTATTASTVGVRARHWSTLYLTDCFVNCAGGVYGIRCDQSYALPTGTKIVGTSGTTYGWYAINEGIIASLGGNVIDTHKYGVFVTANSSGQCYSSSVYNFIKNCGGGSGRGVYATIAGVVTSTAQNSYSGNDVDESADAASFAYID